MSIDDALRQLLTELPGTKNLSDLFDRATCLSDMKVHFYQPHTLPEVLKGLLSRPWKALPEALKAPAHPMT
jgi:hypothetical protein